MKRMIQFRDTMLEGKSKILNRSRTSKGKRYDSLFIYLPSDLTKDSQFPFSPDDTVLIKIVDKRLVIEKA
jgi:hypothetical protein